MKSHMKVGQNWWEKRVNFQRESSINAEFVFPSKKEDFNIRIFKENGRFLAELPDSIEPYYKGEVEVIDIHDGKYVNQPDKIWGIFV